jgi:predicted ester cyclase
MFYCTITVLDTVKQQRNRRQGLVTATKKSGIEVLRMVVEQGFSKGNLDALDGIVAADYVEHQPGLGLDLEGFKHAIAGLRASFPDFTLTIEDLTVDGDMVWARLKARGTHGGPLFGLQPTGKQIEVDVFDLIRVEDGMLVEHWGVPDRFTILDQLGLLPHPAGTP